MSAEPLSHAATPSFPGILNEMCLRPPEMACRCMQQCSVRLPTCRMVERRPLGSRLQYQCPRPAGVGERAMVLALGEALMTAGIGQLVRLEISPAPRVRHSPMAGIGKHRAVPLELDALDVPPATRPIECALVEFRVVGDDWAPLEQPCHGRR